MRILLVLVALLALALAHDECCKRKLARQQPQFIVDPTDAAPDVDAHGEPRFIAGAPPDGWDEENDGVWQAPLLENPRYAWTPQLIANPAWIPPVSLLERFSSELRSAAPWLVLGLVVAVALEHAPPLWEHLGSNSQAPAALGSVIKGALAGLVTPLCSCGGMPIAAGLLGGGASLATVAAFLTAAQSSGLDSAAITWGLLGGMAAACRLAGATVLAVVVGLTVDTSAPPAPKVSAVLPPALPRARTWPSARTLLTSLLDRVTETFPSVAVGLALSAAVAHALPSLGETFAAVHNLTAPADASAWWTSAGVALATRALLLAATIPFQLCEHTSVALAAALQKAGCSPGLAFAFLLCAPATNLPTLLFLARASPATATAVSSSFSCARVLRATLALIGAAVALSFVIDSIAGLGSMLLESADAHTSSALSLPAWYARAGVWVAAALAAAAVCRGASRWAASTGNHSHVSDACCNGDHRTDAKKSQ